MSGNWPTIIASVISSFLVGGGLVATVNAVARRRTTRADVVDRLSDAQLKWVEQFQEEAQEARREALDARREAREANREMVEIYRKLAQLHNEVRVLSERLATLINSIHEPNQTIVNLRRMVPLPDSEEPPGAERINRG